jgi:hypothetical protein
MENGQPKKVFISYSWDDDAHKKWVFDLAIRLRRSGLHVILDKWDSGLGDQLTRFMEWAVRESDYVLCVCTPRYKRKSDSREGGAGYEGYIMTAEFFYEQRKRKYIPVLRKGEWMEAAPSWLSGIVYADLRGDPYSEENFQELLNTLKGGASSPMPENRPQEANMQGEKFEFVNREIELATLDPLKLDTTYWQCALVSAPTGYGKTRLLLRLLDDVQKDEAAFAKWNCLYIDMSKCGTPNKAIGYFWEQVCNQPFHSGIDLETARKQVCDTILETMSVHPASGSPCGVLLLIDSLDDLPPESEAWFFGVFNEVVTGSYTDYPSDKPSFAVRLILAGSKIEAFWNRYEKWERASGRKYSLHSRNLLVLSAFKKKDVEDLINRKRKNANLSGVVLNVSDTAEKLLYLSGGHPAVINGILDELIGRKFRGLDDYLVRNIERLIGSHISGVVGKLLQNYPPEKQMDIKTVLVFRMVTLDILAGLRKEKLISWSEDNARFLGFLRDCQFLHFDKEASLYRDEILRRIIYLDFAFASCQNTAHIQEVHRCALEYYEGLIRQEGEQKSAYFIEWLFHALQRASLPKEEIVSKWKALLSAIRPGKILPEDLKKSIGEEMQKDIEIRHLYRGRFGSDNFSPLLDD